MVLDGLTESEMGKLEALAQTRSYQQDEMILLEGEPGTSFYIVLAGHLEIRKSTPDHKFVVLAELKVGDVLGEFGFVSDTPRTASAIARSPVSLLVFDKSRFEPFAEAYPEIGMKIYRNMARVMGKRAADTNDALAESFTVGKDQIHVDGDPPRMLKPKTISPPPDPIPQPALETPS